MPALLNAHAPMAKNCGAGNGSGMVTVVCGVRASQAEQGPVVATNRLARLHCTGCCPPLTWHSASACFTSGSFSAKLCLVTCRRARRLCGLACGLGSCAEWWRSINKQRVHPVGGQRRRRRRRQSRLTSISTRSPVPTAEHANVDKARCLVLSREGWARQQSAACALAAAGGNTRLWRDTIPLLSRSSCPWSLSTRPRVAVQQDMHGCGRATAIAVRQLMASTRGSAEVTMAAARRRRPHGAPCSRPPAQCRRVNSLPADHTHACYTSCVSVVVVWMQAARRWKHLLHGMLRHDRHATPVRPSGACMRASRLGYR